MAATDRASATASAPRRPDQKVRWRQGQGIGGGLYLATGSTTTLTTTVVVGNRDSTSNNEIYGTYE